MEEKYYVNSYTNSKLYKHLNTMFHLLQRYKFILFFELCICVFVCRYVYLWVYVTLRGQKMISETVELQLWMVMSHQM